MEVPNRQPRDFFQRVLEIATGLFPFVFLALLVLLSFFAVRAVAVLMLAYTLLWLIRLLGYSRRLALSFYYLKLSLLIDWPAKLDDIKSQNPDELPASGFWPVRARAWYRKMLGSGVEPGKRLDPAGVYLAVIIATYNEPASVLKPTLEAIKNSQYDLKRVILLIAYEQRGGEEVARTAQRLAKKYGVGLKLSRAIGHPANIPGEIKAKAGNITFAAKYLSQFVVDQKIDPKNVIVTTLDADNQVHPQYFAGLTWTYCLANYRERRSYQPLPLFNNNIWDAPALTRVVATDSTFWFMMAAVNYKRLRIFSAHAQPLDLLEKSNYWNVQSIVEDGHQYWRSFFALRGDHFVMPVWLPISQDAVNLGAWWPTIRAQFAQLRRWAWGVADTPWLIRQSLRDKSIGRRSRLHHILWQVDDYMTWATAPIVLAIGGWLPLWLAPDPTQSMLALRLPYFIGGLQLLAVVGLIVPVVASYLSLPPRPSKYGPAKNLMMLLQWVLEPIALIGFISLASLNAHLRLIINKPLEKFNVTRKSASQPDQPD